MVNKKNIKEMCEYCGQDKNDRISVDSEIFIKKNFSVDYDDTDSKHWVIMCPECKTIRGQIRMQ